MTSKKIFLILFVFSMNIISDNFLTGKNAVYPVLKQSSFRDIQNQIDNWSSPKEPPPRTEWMKAEEYQKLLDEFNDSLKKDYILYAIEVGLSTCNSSNISENKACYDVDDEIFYINRFPDNVVNLNRDFLVNESSSSTSRYNVDGASIDVYEVSVINQDFLSLNVDKVNNIFHEVDVPYSFDFVKDNFYLFNLYGLIKIPLSNNIFSQDKIVSQNASKEAPQEIIHNKKIMNTFFEAYLLTYDGKIIKNFGTSPDSEVKDDSLSVSKQSKPLLIDSEYSPLFKITPIYPRRARERGIMGYTSLLFDVNESGSVENVRVVEGYCSNKDPNDPRAELNSCTTFNSASERAALKLKYVPRKVNGRPVRAENISHKFIYILEN